LPSRAARYASRAGFTKFRVSHKGEGIDDADTIEGAREIARGQPPGRNDVDEIRAEPVLPATPADHGGE
jgi:hypothetical protein